MLFRSNLRLPPADVAPTDGDGRTAAREAAAAAAGLPALAAEDVVPEGVSDAALLKGMPPLERVRV